jgi:ABC-type spermidine/putrescine transport system permease subunit I
MSGATIDLAAPRTRLALFLLAAPALVWLLGLIVLPHVDLAALSLRARIAPRIYEFSFDNYRTFIDEPLYWHTFVRTAAMSIVATACTLLIGFPTAWYIVKIARGQAKSMLFVLCLIPFWVSETVRTLGWMILLRESGSCRSFSSLWESPRNRWKCSIATRRSWSGWCTRRCCSWSYRWPMRWRVSTTL